MITKWRFLLITLNQNWIKQISMNLKFKQPKDYLHSIRCESCGRFISNKELSEGGGGSSCFVPDSEVSVEEIAFRCASCTNKKGACTPIQSGVVKSMCCIRY